MYIGNKLLTGYSGDGLLVATPTGSTAYALSAGGPIVNNEIRSMLMVPISPNSLSFRPILMPASARIIIKVHLVITAAAEECSKQRQDIGGRFREVGDEGRGYPYN